MAVRDDVVLVADGGDVTVGRRTASFVYGEFNVVLPHGRDQVETDERLQDGYVYRPKGGIKGPFDVGFVRADATVDLEADTSDLEVVVDAAQKQVEGDVFFERDISAAGLGQFVLDRDFRVGDVVTVELWGKRLRLPVTAGDYVASASEGPVAARVHVGGQLISDAEAVARQNGDLRRQIAREKAERVRSVSSESSARRSAVRAEREAREVAVSAEARRSDAYADSVASGVESRLSAGFEESYERYSEKLSELGDEWRQELQDGLSAEQQARVEALRHEQLAREQAGTDLRGQLEQALDDAVADERLAREEAISAESLARQSAISAEASAREQAISLEQQERNSALAAEAETREDAISAEAEERREALASEEAARKAAISAEAQARALGDSNEAQARQKAISDLSTSFSTELETYGELVKEAKEYVDPATQQVVNFWSEENQNNFNKAVQLTLSAQSAYNDLNSIKWISQDAWNEQQEEINDQNREFRELQTVINDEQTGINALNTRFQKESEERHREQGEVNDRLESQQDSLDYLLAQVIMRTPQIYSFRFGNGVKSVEIGRWGNMLLRDGDGVFHKTPGWWGTVAIQANVKATDNYGASSSWKVSSGGGMFVMDVGTFDYVESGLVIIAVHGVE